MRSPLLLIVATIAAGAVAQRPYFEHLAVADGLPSGKVYTLLQDSTGLVWMGTEAGLVSYDGINVRQFGEAEGLRNSSIGSLCLDRSGRLWTGHKDGSIGVGNGTRFQMVEVEPAIDGSDVTAIVDDGSGGLWISTMGSGVLHVNAADPAAPLAVERYGPAQGVLDHVFSMQVLKDGSLAVIEDGGTMKKWDSGSARFVPLEWPGLEDVLQITSAFIDSQGRVWLGTVSRGVFTLEPKSGQVVNYDQSNGLKSNFIMCFGEDAAGQVWVGMLDGGVAVIGLNGVRRAYHPDSGFPVATVRRILRDREGNMLLCSFDDGVFVFKGERFLNFIEEDGLLDPKVWAVLEDRDERVWFGTDGGISVLDPKAVGTGVVKTISMQQGELTSNQVRSLCEDDRGHIWIGTETGGIIELDPQGYQPIEHLDLLDVIPGSKVTALANGGRGAILIGTVKGLVRVEPGLPPVVFTDDDGVPTTDVTALFRTEDGTLWVGSKGEGITLVKGRKGERLKLDRAFTPTCFAQDNDGRMWVGTESQGVLVLADGKEVARYTTDQGLLANSVRSMVRDKDGHIWIGTSKGLNKWRPKKDGFLSFTQRSGFIGVEAKPNAVALTRSGDIWFGTNSGATRITVEKGSDKSLLPVVAIAGLRVNDEERDPEQGLNLSHTERKVRIDFRSVSLGDPGAVRYRFMLEGLDEDWQTVTQEASASYPALPPGSYGFKVKAMDRAGTWSEPAVYRFNVLPPWYRSWWFYSAVVVLGAIVLFSWIKVRERQLRLRNLVLEQKVEERTAEVVSQSKEIAQQKDQIEDLLLNILPKEISDELKVKGKATARRHEEVTVVFTDMKGFTRIAEKMTPEQLVNDLHDCFLHFDEVVDKYGIEKIKTIGDSYMCAGGVPTTDPHNAHKAVLAALEIRDLMLAQADQRRAAGNEPWVLRIGVHTGPVVAGVVGKRKFAYDIWGDAVNTASRMESSGEPGEVNISGATYALVKDRFECVHRGKVQAKNKGEIDMYFVMRIKPEFSADTNGTQPNERFRKELNLEEVMV